MLQARALSYQLNDHWIVQNLDFSVQPGECLHLVGANGAGKSTVLKLLAGLLTPAQGRVLWQSNDIQSRLSDYHTQLAYIGHRIGVKPMLTVAEQVDFADEELIKNMGLHFISNVMGEALSAGQKQRVALTRLITQPAQLWLLDEPFTALDQLGVRTFGQYLQQHCANGGSVVISSHQPITLDGVPIISVSLGSREVSV